MNTENNEYIAHIRHTLAHLLASVVLEKYPEAKLTLGPSVDNGFYYDIDFGEEKVGDEDLKGLQKLMRKKLSSWDSFEHKEVSADEAREMYKNNTYKTELINEIEERGEKITLYTVGGFTDLCRGGHVESPAKEIDAKAFELSHVAGAYWRGDENNTMLTRVYGLAFETPEKLSEYKTMVLEAKKRDHRKLGQELDLFTFSDLVGSGLPLFTPKGTLIRDLIVEKIQNLQKDFGYQKVTIPHITKKDLYVTSGHWEKFSDDLFHVKGKSDTEFVMKPMNCPHHTQIFDSKPRSYRDLPIRFMESTMVYRDEQQGELLGLSRVRSITQDDGHVFCTPDQMEEEVKNIVSVIKEFYTSLGMLEDGKYWVSLSVRSEEKKDKYLGDNSSWDMAEAALEKVAKEENLPYKRVEGEAAFYGPKLDFQFKDAIGREWQLGTAQLDFQMPERFKLTYTDSDGEKKTPVMIHRAVAGSLERFMALAIEHFAGAFPYWLSPVQAVVMPVNDEAHGDYAEEVYKKLKEAGVRVEYSEATESLAKRMRNSKKEKTPYIFVLGDKEKESNTITAEGRGDEKLEGISVEEFIKDRN
ncbi:MAG: threonyl-tRNA synthetase [Candidatus Paceibacteria bacterium]|jgi:threonyl-tRNA synthetase